MADTENATKYETKRLSVIEKLSKKGQVVQIRSKTSTGDVHNRVFGTTDTPHNALPLKLEDKDIGGNVKSTDNKWMVDASNVITSDDSLVTDKEEAIVDIRPLSPDGQTVIYYEVYSRR